jgi:hypothetical protein
LAQSRLDGSQLFEDLFIMGAGSTLIRDIKTFDLV